MKAKLYRDLKTNEQVYEIRIDSLDLSCPLLDSWDRKLIKECDESTTLSDKLLALETIIRRNEEYRES